MPSDLAHTYRRGLISMNDALDTAIVAIDRAFTMANESSADVDKKVSMLTAVDILIDTLNAAVQP